MNQIFDIKRALLLSKLKFSLNRKMFFIAVGGYLGLIFVITFLIAYHLPDKKAFVLNDFHLGAFTFMLLGGAIFIGGRAYYEMNSPAKSISQILIPASTFEKYIIPWVVTSLGWIIFSVITYQVFALLVNGLWSLIFNLEFGSANLMHAFKDPALSEMYKAYFLLHAIFFLGATAFRKYAIPKTALATFIIYVSFMIFGIFLSIIFFGSLKDFGFAMDAMTHNPAISDWFNEVNMFRLARLFRLMAYIVLPLILYVVAFFKLKEREV